MSNQVTVSFSISNLLTVLVVLISLVLLYLLRSIVLLIFLSYIIATALSPTATRIERRLKLPRVMSILVTYVLFLLGLSFMIGMLIPPLATQVNQLVSLLDTPALKEAFATFNLTLGELSTIAGNFGGPVGTVASIISSTFSGLFTAFAVLVMSFYMTQEKPRLHHRLMWFTTHGPHIEKLKDFLLDLEKQLGGWVRGQATLMAVIGTMTFTGLTILGIPYALPLALLAGLLEIVPNIGPTIAAVPAVFVAYVTLGPVMAGVVLLLNIVIQQLENTVIVPRIMQRSVNINPLVTITVLLMGMKLMGVMGALLAVPVYLMLRTFYATFLRDKIRSKALQSSV